MSKEIKMSDVFDGDVHHFGGGSIGDDRCDEFALAQFEDSTEAEYSCHAINNHDALTEQVRQLRGALADSQKLINTTGDIQFNNGYSAKEKDRRMKMLFDIHGDDIFLANKRLLEAAK